MSSSNANQSLFTDQFKTIPYWWDTVASLTDELTPLPVSVDVLVIGAGYTGLNAAIQTSRGGRSTLVLDAEDAGWGCSTRNGGQISTSLKPGLDTLQKRHGERIGRELMAEGQRSLSWIGDFIADENIDCDFTVCGRFHAAHNAARYGHLARQAEVSAKDLGTEAFAVPRAEQHRELGTDTYYGGVVFPQHASLNPAKYHRGLMTLAQAAGAEVRGHCAVTNLEKSGDGYLVHTPGGVVRAGKVVVATNGYTGSLTPWLRRRVIPIGSYVIATDELPAHVMDQLMPRNRIVSDSRRVVYYYRPSPDRKRIVFGGRVSHNETDPLKSAPLLMRDLRYIFPELQTVKVSHSWMGFVAYTFDTLMHMGKRDGLHYAMGYCGSGVGMASYLGMRLGQQVIGLPDGRTAFDDLPFPTRPLYTGNPWFLGASVMYYRWLDRLPI